MCHFPNCLENTAKIQDKWWLACQMSNTSTIHLQRSIHFSQCTALFRKFVNHFDASYRDNEPLFEPELQGGSNMTRTCAACLHTNQSRSYLNHLVTDLHCSDKFGLNSIKMMCLLLQLFSYDGYPNMQQRTTVCWSFSGSNSHLTCFKYVVQAQWAHTSVSFNLFRNTLNTNIFVNF